MKNKFLIGLTIILCLVLMATPVMAAGGAAVSSATGTPGSTVFLTVSLSGYDMADTLSVSVSGLTLDISQSSWLKAGALADFTGSAGVWAAAAPIDVNGSIAKLAFTVPTPEAGQTDLDYEVTVTVRVKNDTEDLGSTSATGVVSVSNPATNIVVEPGSVTLTMGGTETAELTATVTPSNTTDKVVWSSSDESVATVSGGKVTAHKGGVATITATAGSLSQTCKVVVICPHPALTETPAKAATCTAVGNNQYWTCDDCATVLAADKTTVTTVAEQTLEMLAHTYGTSWSTDANNHYHLCTGCNTAKADETAHDFKWVTDLAATETATGLKHEECSVCGLKRSEDTVIDKLTHTHTGITHHAPVAATCVAKGNVEYWTCSSELCAGKYYGDANCQNELADIVTDINADNHRFDTAWNADENNHYHLCADCKTAKSEEAAHDFKWVTDKRASEVETGLKHEECSVCGLKRSEDTVIDKLKHYPKLVEGKEPTCLEEGVLEHYYCGNCGGRYAVENGKPGKRITKEATILEATGHTYENEWVYDDENHWRFCGCGEMSEKEAHKAELVGQVDATDAQEGYTGDQVCSVCQNILEKGEVIPCVTVPTEVPTEAPTEAPVEAPTEAPVVQEEEKGGNGWLLIVAGIAAVAAAGVGIAIPVLKKKRQ